MNKTPDAFVVKGTTKILSDSVVSHATRETWDIYVINGSIPKLICSLGIGQGQEVTRACIGLAETTGKPWIKDVSAVIIPPPEICIGCGRQLVDGKCLYLVAKGMKSHRRKPQ